MYILKSNEGLCYCFERMPTFDSVLIIQWFEYILSSTTERSLKNSSNFQKET